MKGRGERGFSLIEMVIVVVVIMVIASLAMMFSSVAVVGNALRLRRFRTSIRAAE